MNILVVGGGISGISAAKVALREGHDVTVIECTGEPGGLMARIANCRVGFKTFFDEIRDKPRLTVIRDARIAKVEKRENVFTVILEDGQSIRADRVIIAAGLSPYDPVEYKGKRVLTSLEYDAVIDQRNGDLPADFEKIGFFLCVGSRSKEYPLCSSVCCSYTLREVKWTLQRAKPEITVFYNDLRFFGQEFLMEKAYRDAGVRFVRANSRYFEEDDDGVTVRYFAAGGLKEERFNYAILAIGLRPNPELERLSGLFGFSRDEFGFAVEKEPLKADADGVYLAGGSIEPMSIKDAILTGFGAAMRAVNDGDGRVSGVLEDKVHTEIPGDLPDINRSHTSYLFYLGTEDPWMKMFYEYVSGRFIALARELRSLGKNVYVVSRNMVVPSYGEIEYEKARREGVVFLHLEEEDSVTFLENEARIAGKDREAVLTVDKVIGFDDCLKLFEGKEFLMQFRSEPQLRWSPTKWSREKYHAGFIRYPRGERWSRREFYGALGEILLDVEEERILPEVSEDRCSGCGSCKEACPHDAIEMEMREQQVALFGPNVVSCAPIAHVKEGSCVGCGLCAATCPSHVISYPV
ncbi:FAD-dependent oxidoreductase [Syntrophorhabdus aromaticivorans]|uniref:FAD-dependent oxidoreductase n=1 Tax=Syntrophorhabdus aromaticivorans TaxID=328301 RepID=A0A971M4J2_9BACT|nr:FAD-dependent oxidoreductase [Syntrophorhabdus aromaticivorans]NLW34976.1 FAD-dependent oxidoreductase [Syntrophorhabdus aromaticivorans]